MSIGARVRRGWASHRTAVVWSAVGVMAVAAAIWLGYETFRFFRQPERIGAIAIHPGAIDLKIFQATVTTWFSGRSVFTGDTAVHAVYPPASMALMWPIFGWGGLATSTVVWWLTAVPAVAWLVRTAVRETGAGTPADRAFAALLPLATYPAGAVIGNGQLTLHVLALLVGGLLLLRDRSGRWRDDLLAAALILLALAKPTIAAPFFWIVIFAARSLRPAVIVVGAYLALTLFAAGFQEPGIVELVRRILDTASALGARAGESNLHSLLVHLGRPGWITPASIGILVILGLWVWRHRDGDYWLLMGVAAFVARFWSYHRWYDDLLILLPMIALYRLAGGGPTHRNLDVWAGVLLASTLVMMVAPGGLYLLPAPWNQVWSGVQVSVWLADLALLLVAAHAERVARADAAGLARFELRRSEP